MATYCAAAATAAGTAFSAVSRGTCATGLTVACEQEQKRPGSCGSLGASDAACASVGAVTAVASAGPWCGAVASGGARSTAPAVAARTAGARVTPRAEQSASRAAVPAVAAVSTRPAP